MLTISAYSMALQDDKLYFKRDLQIYLRSLGIPFSYPTIIKYEKLGVIPSPRLTIEGFENRWRLYTGKEIRDIAEILQKQVRRQAK